MAVDVLVLNALILDLRSPAFTFAGKLAGPGGLAKCATADLPPYTPAELDAFIARSATAGGAGNVAPLLTRAGLAAAVGGYLGRGPYHGLDSAGRAFHDLLAAAGVDLSAVLVHPTLPSGMTFIHEVPAGERGGLACFLNANDDFDFAVFAPHVARLQPRVVQYLYSGLSARGDAHGGRDLAAFIGQCRERGALTIVDSHTLTGDPQAHIDRREPLAAYRLLEPLLPELDIFFTSQDEARLIRLTLDPEYRGDTDAPGFLQFLARRFADRRRTQLFGVTVRDGAHTCLVTPDGALQPPVFHASRFMVGEVRDLVGAGDAFRAGLLTVLARQADAFRRGTPDLAAAVQTGNLMAVLYITAPLHDRYRGIPDAATLARVVQSGRSFATLADLRVALAA